MRAEILGVFIPILAIVGFFGLMSLKTWSNYRLKMQERSGVGSERLGEAVQQLHDELGLMRDEIAELHERVDFTERMLSEVKSKKGIRPGNSS